MRAHGYQEELKYIRQCIREDVDGHQFVDYLRAIQGEMNDPETDYPKFLIKHADLIMDGLVHNRHEVKVFRKFKWLQKYHNDTIDLIFGKGRSKELRA